MRLMLPSPVLRALDILEAAGFEAYAVGGCVRDLLRGETPKDYDIATSARPEQTLAAFSDQRTVPTGLKHGTVTVLMDGMALEITSYRIDLGYTDGRHPDGVRFTDAFCEDAARRDFTINAMGYSPRRGLADHFGGERDLCERLIRAVGDPTLRFTEDALRILRAMRFSAVLGFRIDEATAKAMHAQRAGLARVSRERIREELMKLLAGRSAASVLREFSDVLGVFLPELLPTVGFEQKNPHHIYDVFEHTLHAIEEAECDARLRLALLLHDIGKPSCFSVDGDGIGHFYGHAKKGAEMTADILAGLRFDRATAEHVTRLVALHDTLPVPGTRSITRMRTRHGEAFLSELFRLQRADGAAHEASSHEKSKALFDLAEAELAALCEDGPPITLAGLAVNGRTLLALGVPRGKEIGRLLGLALDAVLEGTLPNDEEALVAFLREIIKKEQSDGNRNRT